jgi:hypothetical protein
MKAMLTVLALVVGCSVGGALITSQLYWGYVFRPPSTDWAALALASTDRFTTFHCCSPARAQSGQVALEEGARVEWHGAGDWPIHNLPMALKKHALAPPSGEAVPVDLLAEARNVLDSAGALVAGDAGYTHAKELWGHVAIGRDARGSDVVLAALWSGEVSNDHHAYYEAAFDRVGGELRLRRVRHYWFDVAGLEGGLANWLGAFAGALVGAAAPIAYVGWWLNRRAA